MSDTDLAPAEELDPFDEFNKANGAGGENPYPSFVAARARGAVGEGLGMALPGLDLDGEPDPDSEIAKAVAEGGGMPGLYSAYTYDAVQQILRDADNFSSSHYSFIMGMVFGRSILEMDEPEHHTYRALLQQAFTRRSMERWETELVEPIVHGLIDGFIDDGRADLVRELHFPFPMNVIAGLLGLPDERLDEFHRLGVEIISVGHNFDGALRASARLGELFTEQIDARRRADRPITDGSDFISVLAAAELDGQRLTDDEILAFLRLLLPAGAETTYRSSANLMFGLLTHTDQLDALRADRELLPQAIEEGIRWEPPLLMITRMAKNDVVVSGVPIPAGSFVMSMLGSANHDESRWEDAEEFDIFREQKPHASFIFGPHTCLGMHLARMETRVAVNALLDRLPNLRLDPDAPPPEITGAMFRAPLSLPVVWD